MNVLWNWVCFSMRMDGMSRSLVVSYMLSGMYRSMMRVMIMMMRLISFFLLLSLLVRRLVVMVVMIMKVLNMVMIDSEVNLVRC